ncbi:hypothetical protein [Burkholderia sp. HI2500]|uniref:hypothetical protein n=1 Tax=Burkholderia sp. HI2500 TaxID=2015358 RepID=UPI0011807083|nr:hypothetical protein [Burkholderia sp. HI2500]
MARIRTIKPEFWTSEQVLELSRDARLLFIGMWNFCDDGGNHPASAKTLKAEVLPADDVSASVVMQWVDELIEQGLLSEYEADGKEFWHVTGWHHQRIDQPTLRHPRGDAVTQGDAGDAASPKRLGGKQRQLLLKKLRDRDGDTCHQCGDAQGDTLLRVTDEAAENPHDVRNYRLICKACKRKNASGDAKVTQGDARYVAGDSTTEGRVGEGNGVESISTQVEQQQESTVEGASPVEGDAVTRGDAVTHPAPSAAVHVPDGSTSVSRAIEIAVYLRQRGVAGANSVNPNIAAWGDDVRVTNEILDAAISKARVSLKGKPLGPNYLATIIPDLLNPAPAQPKREDNAWKRTPAGIERKASELGILCPPGRDHGWLLEKCEAELRNRAQVPA